MDLELLSGTLISPTGLLKKYVLSRDPSNPSVWLHFPKGHLGQSSTFTTESAEKYDRREEF